MANLVSPGYNRSTLMNQVLAPAEERIIEFKGLNKRTVVDEGEMSDMWNLTADKYPVLSPRKPRGSMPVPESAMRPLQILRRFDKIGFIAIDEPDPEEDDPSVTVSFYYDGTRIDEVTGLSTETHAVAINNKMCFFPEKTCIDITLEGVQEGTYRSLEASVELDESVSVVISSDGTRITLPEGHGFKYDDAINISGTLSYTPYGGEATSMPASVSCIIESVEDENTIILPRETFIEMTGEGAENIELTAGTSFERTMPDLDFVVEWNNRLWGCSNRDNTIYACKLGDPTNWQYYQGTSLDSYYAEQGTDERFSGIAEYSGHIMFFKPNSITRVYGTSPASFQITNTKAYGIEYGSSASVLTINDTVYYKSAIGIMAYRGGTPFCISEKLGMEFKNVVAGTEGTKYFASCIVIEDGRYMGRIIVYDIEKGLWHMEDDKRFTSTCKIGNKIYYTSASADILTCDTDIFCNPELMCTTDFVAGEVGIFNPDVPTESYEDIEWKAVFGPFDEYIEEHKIYSKLAMRLKANGEASTKVYISINEGPWELVENYEHVSTKGDFIPIIPRRCDRYSVKVEGKGNCEVKSLTRRVRQGSFGRL